MGTYLVFHVYGPMASFGDTAVGEYRPTYAHPSKSGIIGLVAGAMGIMRTEEEKIRQLFDNLGFGVLVLSHGSLLRDYHTTQVPSAVSVKRHPVYTRKDELGISELNTILSTRDYRMDAVYRVALWSLNGTLNLNDIHKALVSPCFAPYLGRKSCPAALPFQSEVLEAKSVKDALAQTGHNLSELLQHIIGNDDMDKNGNSTFLLYQDPEPGIKGSEQKKVWRKDRLISRRNWQFGDRQEIMIRVGGEDVFQ